MNKERGFTLVELLVVISIMSILAVITFGQFQTAKRKANDVARKGDLNAMNKSLLMHYADYGYFPTEINGGNIDSEWCPTSAGNACPFADPKDANYYYLKTLPKEKVNPAKPYCYLTSGGTQPKAFALFAQLENNEDKDAQDSGGNPKDFVCGGVHYNYEVLSPNGLMISNSEVGTS